jgi:phage gp36-like protein
MAQSLYATPQQFQALSVNPQQVARFNEFNPGAIEATLLSMSSRADLFLTEQFVLPLLEYDMNLTQMVCDMAAYQLFITLGLAPIDENADRNIRMRFKDAIDFLTHVSRKELHPNYIDSSTGQQAAGVFVLCNLPVGFV